MTDATILAPATDLAAGNDARFPNESAAYRIARNALLAEEIELRRHLWRVAEQRGAQRPVDHTRPDIAPARVPLIARRPTRHLGACDVARCPAGIAPLRAQPQGISPVATLAPICRAMPMPASG